MDSNRISIKLGDGNVKDLSILRPLGRGAFGSVYKVCDESGCVYALKSVQCVMPSLHRSAVQEIRCLSALRNPYIVKVFAADFQYDAQNKATIYILLEFCEGGTLNAKLNSPTPVEGCLTWMVQIASALEYLHRNKIMHRDLKPDNVLLSREQDIKVADFGLARTFFSKDDDNEWTSNYLQAYIGTLAGSPFWTAPEVFARHYNEKADVFALGLLFYCIAERQFTIVKQHKFYGAFVEMNGSVRGLGQHLFESTTKNALEFLPFSSRVSNRAMKELLLDMVEYYPSARPDAGVVYERIEKVRSRFFSSTLSTPKKQANVLQQSCW